MPSRLRVVVDARVVTGVGGGPEKTILNSPRFLAERGYRMLCVYLHPPGDPGIEVLRQRAADQGAPFIAVPDRGPLDWRIVPKLLRICREAKAVIWHGHDYKTNLLGLIVNRFRRMRLVTTLHGWVRHTARTPLYYMIDRLMLRFYEQVIGVSEDLTAEARRVGVPRRRCMLLENGIDLSAYTRQGTTPDARRLLGFPENRHLIGAVGRLSPEKGFDLLIQAIARLQASGFDVGLAILGEGDDRARLQAMIQKENLGESCRMCGYVVDPRRHYEAMDVFALSSFREGLPNVLLEAMALNVPVVATRISGIPRLVSHGVDGWLVEPGQLEPLTDGLRRLLSDEELRLRLARAARKTVEERYSFANRMAKLADLYDGMLSSGHGLALRT